MWFMIRGVFDLGEVQVGEGDMDFDNPLHPSNFLKGKDRSGLGRLGRGWGAVHESRYVED